MNHTWRLVTAPTTGWSISERWFGATITGPCFGMFSAPVTSSRNAVRSSTASRNRTTTYSGLRLRGSR